MSLCSHIVGATQLHCLLFHQGPWSQLTHQKPRAWVLSSMEPLNISSYCLRPWNHKCFWQNLETDDLTIHPTMLSMWKGNINISKGCLHTHASHSIVYSSQEHGINQIAHKGMNEWVNTACLHNGLLSWTRDREKLDSRYQIQFNSVLEISRVTKVNIEKEKMAVSKGSQSNWNVACSRK